MEPGEAIRIGGERLGEDLERHLAVQLGVGGLIDLAHAPLADEGGHVVVGDAVTDFLLGEERLIQKLGGSLKRRYGTEVPDATEIRLLTWCLEGIGHGRLRLSHYRYD